MQPRAWIAFVTATLVCGGCARAGIGSERPDSTPLAPDASTVRVVERVAANLDPTHACVPVAWTTMTIDAEANRGQSSSIAVDASGGVHVGYVDADAVRYAHRAPGEAWATSAVEAAAFRFPQWPTSLAVDASGVVHLSYSVPGRPSDRPATDSSAWLRYAYLEPTRGWTASTVDTYGGDGSLAVDASGEVHLAYVYFSGWQMRYAHGRHGAWTTDVPDVVADRHPSVEVDTSGVVHLVYGDGTHTVIYARRDATGAWTKTPIGTAHFPRSSLAVDASGGVHVSYLRAEGDLAHAHRDPLGTWATTIVDSGSIYTGAESSLAVDPDGGVHISYAVIPEKELRYAYRAAAGTWTTTTIDSSMGFGPLSSLAVDEVGGVHISYFADGELRYAYSRRCP